MAAIIEDAVAMKQLCPACKRPLYSARDSSGYVVWCANGDCHQLADGPNEGGHGKSPEKALAVLLAKLGLSKDYVIENDEVLVENPVTGSFEAAPKPKGKRGRKPKNATPENMTIPVGEFTMKDFCTLNNTYPVKALAFIKTVETIKELPSRSSGRGKPAKVWINKA